MVVVGAAWRKGIAPPPVVDPGLLDEHITLCYRERIARYKFSYRAFTNRQISRLLFSKYDSFMKTGRVKFRGRQQRFM